MKRWDAGDTGCGRLVVELQRRMDSMSEGEAIEVVAHDAGAPTDLPAWCRMTGHVLVSADPPVYVLRRRAD